MTQKKTIGIVAGLNRRAATEVKTQLLAQGGNDITVMMTEDNFKIDPDPTFAVSDRKMISFWCLISNAAAISMKSSAKFKRRFWI